MKATDEQFWDAIEKSGGILAHAVRYLWDKYAIQMTRQSVWERATKQKHRLHQIRETNIDRAEAALLRNLNADDPKVRQRAAEFILKTLGKTRGFVERTEHTVTGDLGVNMKSLEHLSDEELQKLAGAEYDDANNESDAGTAEESDPSRDC